MYSEGNEVLKRLKEERLRMGLSQREMSNFLRLSQSDYSKVELGKRLLSYYEMLSLCATDTDVNYIYTGRRPISRYVEMFDGFNYAMLVNCLQILFASGNLCYMKDHCSKKAYLLDQVRYVPLTILGNQDVKERTSYIFMALRSSKQWQQMKMAEELGMDVKKLRDLEKGKKQPDIEIIYRMYKKFGILPAIMLQDRNGLMSEITNALEIMDPVCRDRVLTFLHESRKGTGECESCM